ncbi:ATPase, histidine kinase-, DNA gyrase B (macronuclear) [Tetrahymena thermophila SB210]|uniref:ATPase, histidine kinase-, DNA gyrase B n=1 Tax=Tetrahymena thermophila (strain SB210) TaxID=312017 RepID=Q22UP1_TETTS|nr:ATPase, histidine kinase-, DNA gyrase B [Tetrahymena thermophila SB210]EAR88929.2 ATPase, histidine kinase-, DNA gyrase B [Tetrahymena thermophila SB210]|eukprot:XP_001009174.2 ATPase, histidine kinase-, DNA gyrase B [Tetrahymena thermophila SB210]
MKRESQLVENQTHFIGSNQNIQNQENIVQEEAQEYNTPVMRCVQDQASLQQRNTINQPQISNIRSSIKEISTSPFQVQRERKSTFSRQFQEQIQSAAAVATMRQEEEDKINSKHEDLNDEVNEQAEEQFEVSQKIIQYLKNASFSIFNLITNQVQQFQNKDMETKYIQTRLENTFDSFICIQSCLILSYLALFIINISKGEFSNQANSTQQNSSSQPGNSLQYKFHNSLIEVIWQLIIAILNLGLICISKSDKLTVRGILILCQLAELVNLDRLLFGDINDYLYDSFTNTSSSNSATNDSCSLESSDNLDTYMELRYELIKSFVIMIGCFLFIKNMVGWNFRLLFSLMLTCTFGIILYHENSFWLFLTSLIILTIVFNYYYYYEEKKSRIMFAEIYSHQDQNSPSLYNMIHEQISSGLIVVARNYSEGSNELLQLKFANKISIEQLQCSNESNILQKFKEISVKSEMNKSVGDNKSQGDTSSFDLNSKDNKDDQLENQKGDTKRNSSNNSNQTLYDKLVQYIEDILKAQQEQQKQLNEQNNMMSIHSIKNQKHQVYQPSIINKLKTDQSKKTNSMIQLGKSTQRIQKRQNSSTPFNSKNKIQTPNNHSTLIKANYSSNLIQASNLKQIQSEISIKQKNFSNLQEQNQKTNQNISNIKIENNPDLKLKKKTSFININAVVSSYTPQNAAFNGASPIRGGNIGKSTPSGDEAYYDSQNRGSSNTKIKILQSAFSNNNSPDRRKAADKKNEKSSFGQLIYGVLKSSNQDSQQKSELNQQVLKEQISNQKEKPSSKNRISSTPKQSKYHQKVKDNQFEDESCNIRDEQMQSIDQNIKTVHLGSNNTCKLRKTNNKERNNSKQNEDDENESQESSSSSSSSCKSEENATKDKNMFANSTIQVQLPTSEISFQQFDFKINLIEWDNSPALIILVTETTEKLVNEKLRELEMYKEELLYTMQHISRTPLNSIINLSDIMLNEYSRQYRITSSQRQIMNIHSILQSNNQIANNANNHQQINAVSINNNNTNINSNQYLRQASTNSQINIVLNNQNNNTPSVINNYPSLNQHFSSVNPQQQLESQQQNNLNQPLNNFISNPNSNSPQKIATQLTNNNANAIFSLQEQQLNELESVVQNLHIIKNNGLILLHTINTVTDLSYFQTNQGKLNIDPESFSLQNVIEEIYDLYLHQIQEKKLTFQFYIPQNLDNVFSDKKRVLQVLFEIIGNAIKYTNNGFIQVKIKEQEKGLIWVKVQDSGQGMSESQKHSLFSNKLIQYYSRERDFSKKNSAGLGLDFSRKVVGILGPFHEIFIKSSEGVGSAFKFLLYSDYKIKNKVDIHELKQRLQKLQIQNELGGGIFTPDILHPQKNEINFFSQNNQTANISQQAHAQSSNQMLMKKINENQQHPQSTFQKHIKRGSNNLVQNQIPNTNNSRIYDINDFNGAVSDVVEGEFQSNNKIVQNTTKKDIENQTQNFNGFNGDKSNLSYLKYSQPKMEKYMSLEYDTNQKYRFPQSAQLNQVSTFDHEGALSSAIGGGLNNKKKKKNQSKGQHLNSQHALQVQQQRIGQIISDNKKMISDQRIPCIDINEDIEQKYNGGEGDMDSNLKSLNLNKGYKQNHSQDSQNKSHKIDQNNYSTRNIDDSTAQNQNSNNLNFNMHHRQSFVTPFNHEIKEQDNIVQVHINSYFQNIHESPHIQSQRLNHSQNVSDDSCITVGAINNFLHQSQSVDQSGQFPKRVYNSTSTKPNNLKQLGPSIFMQRFPQNQEHQQNQQQYFNLHLQKPNLFNFNTISHQRIEINQVVNKNNVVDDFENQEPPPEQSLLEHGSPGIQNKHESIYIDQISPHPKLGYKVQSLIQQQQQQQQQILQQQSPQNNQQQVSQIQQYQPSSPFKRVKLERKETKNSTLICQTLKIDDYDSMLYHTFPEKSYVLGVDDNIFNLNILEMVFKKCSNVIFHKAGNGEEALQKVKELKNSQNAYYKVFLLDIQMPIMDGYKTHSELKKLMKKKFIEHSPVFAVTAFANEKQICIQQGMEGFIEKPINMKLLINLMFDYFVKNIRNNNS